MAKLAEKIKADFINEFKAFSERMENAVEERVRETGSCYVYLGDKFEVGWDNSTASYIRIPRRLISIIEREYSYHGFRIDHQYSPGGRLIRIVIRL